MSKDTVVTTFGRMSPPTTGHKKLVDHIKSLAKHHGADHKIFLSSKHDNKDNPLTHKQKVHFVQQMMPGTHVHEESDVKHPLDMMKHLEKHGYKHVHVVVGQDRVKEFHNLLHKYNGHEYNFDSIKVHSAGQRDPDAEGTEGMSASKMREHARTGNFKEFSKGVPSHKYAKDLYKATRVGMKVQENVAMFVLGAPGSGKDMLLRTTVLNDNQLLEVNLDKLHQAIKEGKNVPEITRGEPLIVNGNAMDNQKVLLVKMVLEKVGYKTGCVYVYTTDDVSKQRNEQRIKLGAKTITEQVRSQKYSASVANIKLFESGFGTFLLFNNSAQPNDEQVVSWKLELDEAFKAFFAGSPSLDETVGEFLDEAIGPIPGKTLTFMAPTSVRTKYTQLHKRPGNDDFKSINKDSIKNTTPGQQKTAGLVPAVPTVKSTQSSSSNEPTKRINPANGKPLGDVAGAISSKKPTSQLGEDKASETGAHQALTQTARHRILTRVKADDYFSHNAKSANPPVPPPQANKPVEENLQELSRSTLVSYVKKALPYQMDKTQVKSSKRTTGINAALDRVAHKPVTEENPEMAPTFSAFVKKHNASRKGTKAASDPGSNGLPTVPGKASVSSGGGVGLTNEDADNALENKVDKSKGPKKGVKAPTSLGQIRPLSQDGGGTAPIMATEATVQSSTGHYYEVKANHAAHIHGEGVHQNGQKKEHYDVYHNGEHIGHVRTYDAYQDKKAPGSRIVSSRKNVRHWEAQLKSGHHSETYVPHRDAEGNLKYTKKSGSASSMRNPTKKYALEDLFRMHNRHLTNPIQEHAPLGHRIEAHGVKGMASKQWRKTFKHGEDMAKWAEHYGADVHATRDLEPGEMHPDTKPLALEATGAPVKITKDNGKPAKATKEPSSSRPPGAGDDQCNIATFPMEGKQPPSKNPKKAVKPPKTQAAATWGGQNMTAATKMLSFEEFRSNLKPKSPDAEFETVTDECYEDWGVPGEDAVLEGRVIKTNKPFRTSSTKYRVYVRDGDSIKSIDFNKKGSMTLQEVLENA